MQIEEEEGVAEELLLLSREEGEEEEEQSWATGEEEGKRWIEDAEREEREEGALCGLVGSVFERRREGEEEALWLVLD